MSKLDNTRIPGDEAKQEVEAMLAEQREMRAVLERGMRRLWVAVLVLGALVLGLVGHELWEREAEDPRGPMVLMNPLPPEVLTAPTNERQPNVVKPVAAPVPELSEVPKVGNYEIGMPTAINPDEKQPAVQIQR